jgi:hypothetical protein
MGERMGANERELYRSSNGDCWFLSRDPQTDRPIVKHVPNAPSGGRTSLIEIGAFLATGGSGPEHRELLRLIGTLVEDHTHGFERSSSEQGPDRKRSEEEGGYYVDELAQRHGISNDQASRLIRQIGPDRDKLDAEAEKLTKR